jgi:hypothetical protein
MKRAPSRRPTLETFLWVLASVLAFVAFLLFAPGFLTPPAATAKSSNVLPTITPRPTLTPLPAITSAPPFPPPPRVQTPQPAPTLAANTQLYTFVADPTMSGWVHAGESLAHWGDRSLNAGILRGQQYQTLLYFDLSRILYADLQITGLQRDKLSAAGSWTLRLLRPDLISNWINRSPSDLAQAPAAADVGTALKPENLGVGLVNQFIFKPDQLALLDEAIDGNGILTFRIDGVSEGRDSLFVWDSGGTDFKSGAHPTLRLVAVPGKFISITNTPTPANIITAAAVAQTVAAQVARQGTPTPFPRNYATATPYILITPQPTPLNPLTPTAQAALATAVALTTGTYTPTPSNWATAFPTATPLFIPLDTLTPFATPTPIPLPEQLIQTPVPNELRGNILFFSDHFGTKMPLMMSPNGTLLQVLSGTDVYNQAQAREYFSPERSRQAIQLADSAGILQIGIFDLKNGWKTQITSLNKGLTYDPAWSPDGSKIAYVSTQTGMTEIFVYDLGTRKSRQLTFSSGVVYNQRPTWSPDGRMIAFKSNRDTGHFQIWVMNADGSDMHNISNSPYNDIDPVWVK